jgi:hypothetical protein
MQKAYVQMKLEYTSRQGVNKRKGEEDAKLYE